MLFSYVKIPSFLAKAHLVFYWCLYNKRPLLHLGPNVITDRTFITLGFEMLLQMGLLLCLGPNVNVVTDTTFNLLHFGPVIALVPSTTVL